MTNIFERRPKQEVIAIDRNVELCVRPQRKPDLQERALISGSVNSNKVLALNYEYDMDGDGDPLDDKTKNPLPNILRTGRSRRNTSFKFTALTSPLIFTPFWFIPVGLLILGTVLTIKHKRRVSDSDNYVNPLL